MFLKSSNITFFKKFAVKLKSAFLNNLINNLVVRELEIKLKVVDDRSNTNTAQKNGDKEDKIIWFCWFQGLENAPLLVRKCFRNLELNKPKDFEIKVITESNYQEYLELPKFIEEKVAQGIISKTHFSDLLRFSLLAKYGGLWIDSTILVLNNLDGILNNNTFLTLKNNNFDKYTSISNGLWTSFFIKSDANNPGIRFIKNCLIKYWETENEVFDYYLLDYIILLAYKKCPVLRDQILNNPYCGNNRYLLKNIMNFGVNINDTQKLDDDPIKIYKLNNKMDYVEYTSDGKETYYKKIIKN